MSFQAVSLADFERGLWSQKTASGLSSLSVNPHFSGQDRNTFKVSPVVLGTAPTGNLLPRRVSGRNAQQRLAEELVHSQKLKGKKVSPKRKQVSCINSGMLVQWTIIAQEKEGQASATDGVTIGEPADSFGQAARHGRVTLCDSIDTNF